MAPSIILGMRSKLVLVPTSSCVSFSLGIWTPSGARKYPKGASALSTPKIPQPRYCSGALPPILGKYAEKITAFDVFIRTKSEKTDTLLPN